MRNIYEERDSLRYAIIETEAKGEAVRIQKEKLKSARKMLYMGKSSIEAISKITGLSVEEVKKL